MSSLTNERLRYWLTTNQASRERLCAGLMPVLGEYSNVRPRRPEGGPDGGRDLDAVYRGHIAAAIAIGFRNNVRDDDEDKKWVRNKALSDAQNAKTRTRARHFVFITNVDLTPAEAAELTKSIYDAGFGSCDVIYRERLRLALDSPEGFALRAMHLQIPLDVAEQATFFAKFAENLNSNASSVILDRLSRLELRLERDHEIKEIQLEFTVREKKWWHLMIGQPLVIDFMPSRFGDDRFVRTLSILLRRPPRRGKREFVNARVSARARVTGRNSDTERVLRDVSLDIVSQRDDQFTLHVPAAELMPLPGVATPLGSMDLMWWSILLSESVAAFISEIVLIADSWILARLHHSDDHTPASEVRSPKHNLLEWSPDIHLRERRARLIKYGFSEIDFRRIRPERVWDAWEAE